MKKDILIDINILLFWFFDSKKLKKHMKLFDGVTILISPYSIWEITIKEQIGKLKLPIPHVHLITSDQNFEAYNYTNISIIK